MKCESDYLDWYPPESTVCLECAAIDDRNNLATLKPLITSNLDDVSSKAISGESRGRDELIGRDLNNPKGGDESRRNENIKRIFIKNRKEISAKYDISNDLDEIPALLGFGCKKCYGIEDGKIIGEEIEDEDEKKLYCVDCGDTVSVGSVDNQCEDKIKCCPECRLTIIMPILGPDDNDAKEARGAYSLGPTNVHLCQGSPKSFI